MISWQVAKLPLLLLHLLEMHYQQYLRQPVVQQQEG
jgi:hypothetical protein